MYRMDTKTIVKEVIKDFKKECDCDFTENTICEIMIRLIEPYEENLNVEEKYAVFLSALYYLKYKGEIEETINDEFSEKILDNYFSKDLDELLDNAEVYKWVPEELNEVTNWGNEIFVAAKEKYFEPESNVDVEKYNNLFSQMVEMKKKLESIEYIYRNKNEIMDIYGKEISESQLDINTIQGNRIISSFRLWNCIEDVIE